MVRRVNPRCPTVPGGKKRPTCLAVTSLVVPRQAHKCDAAPDFRPFISEYTSERVSMSSDPSVCSGPDPVSPHEPAGASAGRTVVILRVRMA